MRGSSMWRQLALTDWHLANGALSCEKSKLADRRRLGSGYEVDFPSLRWLTPIEAATGEAGRLQAIRADIERHPDESDRVRASRLSSLLGRSESTVRLLIADVRRDMASDDEAALS
jgi:hypothetical protein